QYNFTRVLYQPDDPDRLRNQTVRAIHEDRRGNLWIRTFDGIYVYSSELKLKYRSAHSEEYKYSYEDIYCTRPLFEDRSGTIWYYSRDAICKCYPKQHNFNAMTGFEPHYINCISQDSHHNIYFGSETVYRFNTQDKTLENLTFSQPGNSLNLLGIEAMAFDRQREILWIGSGRGGIYKISHPADSLRKIKKYGELYYQNAGLVQSPVGSLFLDNTGKIWVIGPKDLPVLFDPDSERYWKLYSGPPGQELLEPGSEILHEYKNGSLLILGKGGLYRFHPPFRTIPENTIAADNISYLGGISIDGSTKLGNKIFHSLMDSRGSLWLATINWGLIKITGTGNLSNHKTPPAVERYTSSDGLPSNSLRSLVEDQKGNLWIGTEFGLSKMDPVRHLFTSFNMYHGLPSNGFRRESVVRTADNHLFFGTRGGVVYFDPDMGSGSQEIPQMLITGLRIHNQEVIPGKGSILEKPVFLTDTVRLDHHQNHLSFEFAALNYIRAHNNQYKYMLEGVDQDWVYCGNRSFTTYSDLKPGNYTFRVIGSNNNGLWNMEGKSLYIVITPSLFRTQAALIIYLLMILLSIYGFIKYQTARLRREKVLLEKEVSIRTVEIMDTNEILRDQKEKIQSHKDALEKSNLKISELDQLKTRFFNNVSHEFRTLITLIKGPVEEVMEDGKISIKSRGSLEVVRRNSHRLMKLVNQLLDISKIDKGNMKLMMVNANVFDYAHAIAVSYTALAESKGIHYRFHLPDTDRCEWFDADKLEKIITNLLSNAFKFTDEGGKVVMEMVQKAHYNGLENVLYISISDTGHGIPTEEQQKIFDRFYQAEAHLKKEGGGTGIGLALTHELVNLMHGTIEVDSEPEMGSAFTVRIPLGKDHLKRSEYSINEISQVTGKGASESAEVLITEGDNHARKVRDEVAPDDITTVLVVEDNADVRTMIADNLESEFKVIEAVDGSAGLKLATKHLPDLVITDLMMPRMGGIEMCSQLKTDIQTSHIPVIMLTAKATLEDKMEGLETGADDYIFKPFDIKEVKVRTKNLIEQRRKLREKFRKEITIDPREIVITSIDEKFLKKAMEIVETHMSDEKFDVPGLCKEMNMSRSTLFRKLHALTSLSPVEFIRTIRLKRAASLLKQRYGNVYEVALEVGFSNPSYFTRMFRRSYEVSPSEYAKSSK
ncbi:MAG: ATP-binding protein, partial [Bacteroidota bacterium]